jgi:hypothetical protein
MIVISDSEADPPRARRDLKTIRTDSVDLWTTQPEQGYSRERQAAAAFYDHKQTPKHHAFSKTWPEFRQEFHAI